MNTSYYDKYQKYKFKYSLLKLKSQYGNGINLIDGNIKYVFFVYNKITHNNITYFTKQPVHIQMALSSSAQNTLAQNTLAQNAPTTQPAQNTPTQKSTQNTPTTQPTQRSNQNTPTTQPTQRSTQNTPTQRSTQNTPTQPTQINYINNNERFFSSDITPSEINTITQNELANNNSLNVVTFPIIEDNSDALQLNLKIFTILQEIKNEMSIANKVEFIKKIKRITYGNPLIPNQRNVGGENKIVFNIYPHTATNINDANKFTCTIKSKSNLQGKITGEFIKNEFIQNDNKFGSFLIIKIGDNYYIAYNSVTMSKKEDNIDVIITNKNNSTELGEGQIFSEMINGIDKMLRPK
jgi:hypothetical protein